MIIRTRFGPGDLKVFFSRPRSISSASAKVRAGLEAHTSTPKVARPGRLDVINILQAHRPGRWGTYTLYFLMLKTSNLRTDHGGVAKERFWEKIYIRGLHISTERMNHPNPIKTGRVRRYIRIKHSSE